MTSGPSSRPSGIRGNGLESSGELLQALGHPDPFDPSRACRRPVAHARPAPAAERSAPGPRPEVRAADQKVETVAAGWASSTTADFALPAVEPRPLPDPAARQAYEEVVAAIAKRQPESETTALVTKLSPETIDEAIRLAEDDADRFDKACEPVGETVKRLKAMFKDLGAAVRPLRGGTGPTAEAVGLFDRLDAGFRAAAMDYEARRYRAEAAFNRRAAEAYEVRVRRSGIESDRHRERSKLFFYSMLLAQVGATVSALARGPSGACCGCWRP